MKIRTAGYWAATGLAAFAFGAGGVIDLLRGPDVVAGLAHLGYPLYFASLIGVWKVLGAVAIVAPGFPRLKEWAYAGMLFDLTGAAVSHAASGDGPPQVLTPLVVLAIVIASYVLRPDSRRLPAHASAALPASAPRGKSEDMLAA